jgi:hypothetical protein
MTTMIMMLLRKMTKETFFLVLGWKKLKSVETKGGTNTEALSCPWARQFWGEILRIRHQHPLGIWLFSTAVQLNCHTAEHRSTYLRLLSTHLTFWKYFSTRKWISCLEILESNLQKVSFICCNWSSLTYIFSSSVDSRKIGPGIKFV